MRCPNCDHETEEPTCPECKTRVLSDSDDTMDTLIEKASIPNLAALFQRGKDKGIIKAAPEYGGPGTTA